MNENWISTHSDFYPGSATKIGPQSHSLKGFILTNMSKKKLIKQMNLELTNKARKNKFKQETARANLHKIWKHYNVFMVFPWRHGGYIGVSKQQNFSV